jgi:outer membrane protein insertion porin family
MTFHRTTLLLLLLLLSSPGLLAQLHLESIQGAEHFTDDYLRGFFQRMPFDSARSAILRAYYDDGYLDAIVTGDSLQLVEIREGRRYSVASVTILPDSLRGVLLASGWRPDDIVGAPFSSNDVASSAATLVRIVAARGYPLVRVRPTIGIDTATVTVQVTYRVDPGDSVTISSIEIQGNQSTRSSLILTAAAVPPNATFTEELSLQVQQRLKRLNIFGSVAEPQLFRRDSGGYGLLIGVEEGNTNLFDGVIGYQPPDSFSTSGSLTGIVNVSLRNIFGSGRRIGVRWQQQTRVGSELDIRYGEPFIFNQPLDLDIGFRQSQQQGTNRFASYVKRAFTGSLGYGLSDAFTIRLGGSIDWTTPERDSTLPCSSQLLETRLLESTASLVYDTRSNRLNPASGVNYATTYAYGSNAVQGPHPCDTAYPSQEARQRREIDLESYIPIFRGFVGGITLKYHDIEGGVLQESDLLRFGGAGSVRGYRDAQFFASRTAWGNFEIRLLLSELSHALIFFDGGYWSRPADPLRSDIPSNEGWIYGYGVGAQIETALGLVRLAFALGKDDTFTTGKVVFGLVNQF